MDVISWTRTEVIVVITESPTLYSTLSTKMFPQEPSPLN